jgi:hypothetical protein
MASGDGPSQWGFVGKVLGLSLGLAIAFKTLAPRLPIPATDGVSLAIVLTPALGLGAVLLWRLIYLVPPDHANPPRD